VTRSAVAVAGPRVQTIFTRRGIVESLGERRPVG
jgi:hypothetical protein